MLYSERNQFVIGFTVYGINRNINFDFKSHFSMSYFLQVIHALAECSPIVKPSYFDDIVNNTRSLPPVERYMYFQ